MDDTTWHVPRIYQVVFRGRIAGEYMTMDDAVRVANALRDTFGEAPSIKTVDNPEQSAG